MKKTSTGFVIIIFIIGWLVINANSLKAQTSSLNGKEFIYIPYAGICDQSVPILYLYSKNNSNVNIQLFDDNNNIVLDTSFTITSNGTASIIHDEYPWITVFSNKFQINSSDSLYVYFSEYYSNPSFEVGSLIPKLHKGNKYIIPGIYNANGFSFLANALNDNTNFNIVTTGNAVIWQNFNGILIDSITTNIPYTYSLQQSESFSIGNIDCDDAQFAWDTTNITKYRAGSIIQSENCNKFALSTTCGKISSYPWQYQSYSIIDSICVQMRNTIYDFYNNGNDTTWRDPAFSGSAEDLFPINSMGRKYICSPPPNGCEIISFTTPYNNTIIRINGTVWDTLNLGESQVKLFTEPAYIEASHPMSMAISHSFMRDSTGWFWGGAGFIQIPAIEQFAKSGWFFYPSQKFISNSSNQFFNDSVIVFFSKEKSFVIVVVPTVGVNQTLLNNMNIGSLFLSLEGNPQYSTARIEITTGFNELSNPNGLIAWSTSYHTRHNINYSEGFNTEAYQCYGAPLVMSFNKPTYEGKINAIPIENTLTNPYTICVGTPLQYTVVTNADSNLTNVWEFGDGGLTVGDTVYHTYADTGYYHVNLFVNSYCDTIKGLVHVVSPPVIQLGNDTTICQGSSLLLDASVPGNATYLWSTGSTLPQITVSDTGTYHVTTTTEVGCVVSDTIHISMFSPVNVNLGKDTVLCYLANILLDATQTAAVHAGYLWQDQSTNSTYTVIYQGQYWVVVTNLCTQKSDTINIENLMNPTLYLGNDTTICMNHKLLLNASIPWGVNYQWENGSTNATRIIENEGIYWVQASNPCVSVSDTIFIKVDDCDPLLVIPNVFTPNSDGLNDVFKAGAIRNIASLNIMIFNRWGENIFQSNNLNFAWNGQYQSQQCSEGVYFWVIQYVDSNGNKHDLSGTVTLFR